MDRFDLYELCVTDAPRTARFLHAVHGGDPLILREDFSGSAALAREWAATRGPAIAVDSDPVPLKRCQDIDRLEPIVGDVRKCSKKADIIAGTNFPLGYCHTRKGLIAYLRHARRCLKSRGVLACDMYGGTDAFTTGTTVQRFKGPAGESIRYEWEQVEASAKTGRVKNAIHFDYKPRGQPRVLRREAFVYDWRLWGVPELVDAFHDAGFKKVEVYDRLGGAIDHTGQLHVQPVPDDEPLDETFVVYVVGRR